MLRIVTPQANEFTPSRCRIRRQTWSDGLGHDAAQYVDELRCSNGLLPLGAERKPRPMSGSDGVGHALTCLIYTIFVPPAGPSVVVFSARAVLPPIRDPDTRVRFPTVQLLGSTCAIAGRLYSSGRQCSTRMALKWVFSGPL